MKVLKWADAEDIGIALAGKHPDIDPLTVRCRRTRPDSISASRWRRRARGRKPVRSDRCVVVMPAWPDLASVSRIDRRASLANNSKRPIAVQLNMVRPDAKQLPPDPILPDRGAGLNGQVPSSTITNPWYG